METGMTPLLLIVSLYVSFPVLLYLFPWILGHFVYLHILKFPALVDLGRPERILNNTCNLYLTTEEGVSVGVWHTLPVSRWKEATGKGPDWYKEALGDGRPVIVYLHGNAGTRAGSNRVELVKKLSEAAFHVLSLDYRGFGDSSGAPSEAGMTTDALYLYWWAKQHTKGGLVCLWGHSLGTGVATNAALKVQEQGSLVDAVILEAPYTSIWEAVTCHTLYKLYKFLPGFERLVRKILERNNIVFANDKNVKTLSSPLLLLHAEDDRVVPYHMGQKLYKLSLQARKERNVKGHVQMVSYSACRAYSHTKIYKDELLGAIVEEFLQKLEAYQCVDSTESGR